MCYQAAVETYVSALAKTYTDLMATLSVQNKNKKMKKGSGEEPLMLFPACLAKQMEIKINGEYPRSLQFVDDIAQ